MKALQEAKRDGQGSNTWFPSAYERALYQTPLITAKDKKRFLFDKNAERP